MRGRTVLAPGSNTASYRHDPSQLKYCEDTWNQCGVLKYDNMGRVRLRDEALDVYNKQPDYEDYQQGAG